MTKKTYSLNLTKEELWQVINAISQAGSEPDEALSSADEKISRAWQKAKKEEK